jgi:hypothetical protein
MWQETFDEIIQKLKEQVEKLETDGKTKTSILSKINALQKDVKKTIEFKVPWKR